MVRRGKTDNLINIRHTYTLFVDLEVIDEAFHDDEITLESDDGKYSQTLVLGKDGEVVEDRWVKVTFDKLLPERTYSCYHDLKRTQSEPSGRLLLFRGMDLGDVHLNKPEAIGEQDVTTDPVEGLADTSGPSEIEGRPLSFWMQTIGPDKENPSEDYDVDEDEEGGMWLDEDKETDGWEPAEDTNDIERESKYYDEEQGFDTS